MYRMVAKRARSQALAYFPAALPAECVATGDKRCTLVAHHAHAAHGIHLFWSVTIVIIIITLMDSCIPTFV